MKASNRKPLEIGYEIETIPYTTPKPPKTRPAAPPAPVSANTPRQLRPRLKRAAEHMPPPSRPGMYIEITIILGIFCDVNSLDQRDEKYTVM